MLSIAENIRRLVKHHGIKLSDQSQHAELEAIIDEMKSVISGSDGDDIRDGQQYNTKTPNFVETRQEEDSVFRGPVGVHFDQAPYLSQELFVGRGSELDEMAKVLHPTHEPQKRRTLVLGGIRGIGKSQLAFAYALSRSKSCSSVLWLDATSEATLNNSFRRVAILIFDQNSTVLDDKRIVEGVHRWLSDPKNTRWLLIFDGYDEQFTISDYYPPKSHGAIIVTTRQPDLVPSSTHILHIKAFHNIKDSLAVLQTRSKRQNTTTEANSEYQEEYQSDISNPPSVFSVQSLLSSALTTDTHFSANELSTALDELVGIFMDDIELAPLYSEAIVARRITLARFVRNFRRLLKGFAVDLKEESQEAVYIDLANFISSRAGLISDKMGRNLEQKFSQPGNTSIRLQDTQAKGEFQYSLDKELHNESSDDEDGHEPERALDEKFAALVSHGRGFIEASTALHKLREGFKEFVIPTIKNKEPGAKHFHKAQSWLHKWTYFRALGGLRYEAQRLMKVLQFFKWLLSEIELLEKAVPENHQRFRWTNLYDDYVEHKPGALKKLQDYLTSTTVPADPRNVSPTNSQGQPSRAASMYTPSPSSLSIGVSTSNDTTIQPTHPASNIRTGITQNTSPGGSSAGPLLLLSCIERRGHPVELYQEVVTNITDDRELFHSLNRAYHSRRTKFKSFWSLRTLHGIHFMKQRIRMLADPLRPLTTNWPQSNDGLFKRLKDPDSRVAGADWILQQLPKKMGAQLDLNKADMSQAWGIFYREDWDWMRIWIVLGIAFFPPSLLFGILWGILRQDIQGAFGVASWWMAGATIAIGIVGTCT
ncbi:unnamed protein product [Penicillium olsonii]|nr:unnamed protein product [Penicillium olsonii]